MHVLLPVVANEFSKFLCNGDSAPQLLNTGVGKCIPAALMRPVHLPLSLFLRAKYFRVAKLNALKTLCRSFEPLPCPTGTQKSQETLHDECVFAVREEPILHHIDSVDVSFNKRVMGVGLSRWCVGENVYVFATDFNVNNGELGGRAINRCSCVSRRRHSLCVTLSSRWTPQMQIQV